jgi:hypothetical protein
MNAATKKATVRFVRPRPLVVINKKAVGARGAPTAYQRLVCLLTGEQAHSSHEKREWLRGGGLSLTVTVFLAGLVTSGSISGQPEVVNHD